MQGHVGSEAVVLWEGTRGAELGERMFVAGHAGPLVPSHSALRLLTNPFDRMLLSLSVDQDPCCFLLLINLCCRVVDVPCNVVILLL